MQGFKDGMQDAYHNTSDGNAELVTEEALAHASAKVCLNHSGWAHTVAHKPGLAQSLQLKLTCMPCVPPPGMQPEHLADRDSQFASRRTCSYGSAAVCAGCLQHRLRMQAVIMHTLDSASEASSETSCDVD